MNDQNTIITLGEIITKTKLTHNQSKVYSSPGSSMNGRVKKEELQYCMYGQCLLRLMHYIISSRGKYLKVKIFMQKVTYKSAYRRAHFNWRNSIQAYTQYENYA